MSYPFVGKRYKLENFQNYSNVRGPRDLVYVSAGQTTNLSGGDGDAKANCSGNIGGGVVHDGVSGSHGRQHVKEPDGARKGQEE